MPQRLDPKLSVLPAAQTEIWTSLVPAAQLNFVLYGGTAIALHLGHRESLDFDFFRSEPLDKDQEAGLVNGTLIYQPRRGMDQRPGAARQWRLGLSVSVSRAATPASAR